MTRKNFIKILLATVMGFNHLNVMAATPALQNISMEGTPYSLELEMAELLPNSTKGVHMHSGPEVGYVLEGEVTLLIKGQSAKTYKAGQSFQTGAYVVHDTKAGPKGAKVLASLVVEKGKSFALPVL